MEIRVVREDMVDYQGGGLVIAMKIEGFKGRQSWRQGERERESRGYHWFSPELHQEEVT